MRIGGHLTTLDSVLQRVTYRWDTETDILSGSLPTPEGGRGFTGSIELEDAQGAVVTLDLQQGALAALEVVVWPERTERPGLLPPEPRRTAAFTVPARPSQPGIGVMEVDVRMRVETSEDESVIHVALSGGTRQEAVALAENLLIELDGQGELVGFWLLDVPPFGPEE
ncbi:MAG TPA: hypothetical protein VGA22_12425 [Gemmatimonadales bacterium]|jgi:hypothetical protein